MCYNADTILKGGISTMAYKITDSCISCGTCAEQCPMGAISQGDTQYNIDADTCISCGSCAGACPMGAIEEE
jgi:ferredoxin